MSDGVDSLSRLSDPIVGGEWAGWSKWMDEEPFEDLVGPFYAKRADDGTMIAGCRLQAKCIRSGGIAHGGMLITFADYSLFMIAYDAIEGQDGVTVSMTSEFLAAAPLGALLIAKGDVLKRGKSLLFVRGVMSADSVDVLAFSAVMKFVRQVRA